VALRQLEKLGITDIEKRIRFERVVTPADWESKVDVYRGATFNLAHSFKQMLNLRPQNRFEEFDGMYLVGGGTHPGSGWRLPVDLRAVGIAGSARATLHWNLRACSRISKGRSKVRARHSETQRAG
jgi:phytoene desaturase